MVSLRLLIICIPWQRGSSGWLPGLPLWAVSVVTNNHAHVMCRSFYYAGVFDGAMELFFGQLVSGQRPDGGLFDRFLIQCMLFHHAVLTCASYKGTSGAFELSSAARSQVSPHSGTVYLMQCD